ncbi:unnamed protein product [Rhizoctonia solani]|uniref:Ricin B lectin domain-containing protein n=1 Tax=Rhizoctonia solani TaxID=456999 RepID=A0A8H3AT36_9AGAM|nr:unnamed protein product [Rhizoctonia solani]
MGHEIYQSQYSSDRSLSLGTYRILNVREKTAVQISEHDPTKVITWGQHKGENQQWFLQRSGHGYQLQNRQYDAYLAVSNTDNGGLVYASKYPTTWVFLKYQGNHILQLADKNRVLDLHCGSGHNGNVMHIFNQDGSHMPHRIWRLERLGQEELAGSREEIASKGKELLQLREELSNAKSGLSSLQSLLDRQEETISQLQRDLKSKEEALSYSYKLNEESIHLRSQNSILESKLSQQQAETAGLQTKVDRLEYLISQILGKPGNTSVRETS